MFKIYLHIIIISFVFSSDSSDKEKTYYGNWPVNNKPPINLPDTNIDCPNETGCSCLIDSDCNNNNCTQMPRGKYCTPKVGEQFPDFTGIDQFGEKVSIYDFSYNGKYILIEIGATWCAPCHEIANWLTYDNREVYNRRWFKKDYSKIRNLIQNDDIYYIKVIFEDKKNTDVTFNTLYDWFQKYPDEKVPILADSDRFLHTWIKPTGLPTTLLLNENMEIVVFSSRGINNAFDKVIEFYNE